jgi:UDP-N-acetyl-D-mannosaminuronate dehydrogenase
MSLQELDRIYGANDDEVANKTFDFLSIVCRTLHRASSAKVATIIKACENSMLHLPIMYAQQLVLAYPDLPVGEILDLVSTHWRIGKYYCTARVGGYCVNLSSKYIRDGTKNPIPIINNVIEMDKKTPSIYFLPLRKMLRNKKILLLGISYSADLRMAKNCPWENVVEMFEESEILIHDPYFTPEEIKILSGKEYENEWKKNIGNYDAIFFLCNHREYLRGYPKGIKKGAYVFDNLPGGWECYKDRFKEDGIYYFKPGMPYQDLVPR